MEKLGGKVRDFLYPASGNPVNGLSTGHTKSRLALCH